MASMDHENVVRLYAVCMGKDLMLISQFVPQGALISYLKKNKDVLSAHSMLLFAVQIAKVCRTILHTVSGHRDPRCLVLSQVIRIVIAVVACMGII